MRIGILDVLTKKAETWWEYVDFSLTQKQYASLTPQVISVWGRQLGHQIYYATYYGLGDPKSVLPADLDLVFICTHTHHAPLAYALGKLYRREGVRTVIGGPHAKSFPQDCLRYFDLVVLACDKPLIVDIIADRFDPGSIVSSPTAYDDLPLLEERLPEVRRSAFFKGRPYPGSLIPMLASVGCPYSCNFCVDWDTPYRALPAERLAADLRYAAQHFPGTLLAFYDPNFAVRFDETMAVFAQIPPGQHNPYIVESSLTNLRLPRLQRLRDTNCAVMAPGIESWAAYSNKAGVGQTINKPKVEQVVAHFRVLVDYVPYVGANFIFGLDHDQGDEPFELTKEFIVKTPFVWPSLNTPIPYGGTPLYDQLAGEDRILKSLPFSFYNLPYLPIILKHYDPITYMQKMVELYTLVGSPRMLAQRWGSIPALLGKSVHTLRTGLARHRLGIFKTLLHRLQTDRQVLAFHTGQTEVLPDFYAHLYHRHLGQYADLMPLAESRPRLPALSV